MADKNKNKEVLYRVTNIVPHTRLLPTNQFLEVYEVQFITKTGFVSSVDIPKIDFSKERVREMVKVEAIKLEEIYLLTD